MKEETQNKIGMGVAWVIAFITFLVIGWNIWYLVVGGW